MPREGRSAVPCTLRPPPPRSPCSSRKHASGGGQQGTQYAGQGAQRSTPLPAPAPRLQGEWEAGRRPSPVPGVPASALKLEYNLQHVRPKVSTAPCPPSRESTAGGWGGGECPGKSVVSGRGHQRHSPLVQGRGGHGALGRPREQRFCLVSGVVTACADSCPPIAWQVQATAP